jgi:hypothetical protein
MALLARQMGLNLGNTATMNTLAGALAGNLTGNLPLGNSGGMNLQNTGMNNMTPNMNSMGGGGMNMPNSGLNLGGSGMGGGNMAGGGMGNLGGNMGPQNSMGGPPNNMGGMNMGSGMGMGSGSGLNMPMNASSAMDGMGSRQGSNLGGGGYNSGPGNYGSGSSLPISARPGNDVSVAGGMSRGGGMGSGMGGGPRSSDSILIRNLPADCNWQVRKSNGLRITSFAHFNCYNSLASKMFSLLSVSIILMLIIRSDLFLRFILC